MGLNAIDEYYLETECKYLDLTKQTADYVIDDYKKIGQYHKYSDNPLNSLLLNYFNLKSKNKHLPLEEILNKYSFNYNSSIHNAIYDLLLDKEEASILWPGVISKEDNSPLYILKTRNGTISVYKASEIFKNTKSSYIFNKKLVRNCYKRSFDFLSENKDYKAVLSYDANMFVGGHFHAYVEKDDITLDIASNALYMSREEKDKVLKGEIITKLTYDEVINDFNKVREEVPDLDPNDEKLHVQDKIVIIRK